MALTHEISGKHLINGTWIGGGGGGTLDAVAQATGATLSPKFAEAGE